ncbi:MAG: AI-2E family transporter [Rhodobacteraceae bacterium]|nr:AI-2E family transporter [Paracoccaceae bacterium]
MALSAKQQITWWGIAMVVTLLVLYLLGDILLPFIVGMALAYLLDPFVDRFERMGLNRAISTAIVAVISFIVLGSAVVFFVPLLGIQIRELFGILPATLETFVAILQVHFPELISTDSQLGLSLNKFLGFFQNYTNEILIGIYSSFNLAWQAGTFLIIVPVVYIYTLADWDRLIARIDSLLPMDHKDTIRELAGEVDFILSSFVRGQFTICLILGLFYGLSLYLVGLKAGLIIGFIAGLISFIPFLGAILGGVLAIGLALFQFWESPLFISVVGLIFVSGQILEGNILTPKIVGKSVGLHPVWILFSLSAFGFLFGFVGLMVAVPMAAIIGVFLRFGVKQYLDGVLYLGKTGKHGKQKGD